MANDRKPKIIALISTVGVAAVSVLILCLCSLKLAQAEGRTWPPEHHSEIIFDQKLEEVYVPVYAATGDNILEPLEGTGPGASDVTSDDPTQISHDPRDYAPTEGRTTQVTTSEQESPVKVKPNDQAVGNTNPQEEAEKAEALRRQKAEQNAASAMDRFSGRGTGTGNNDNKDNTDGTNAKSGSGNGKGLGMTASSDVRPPSSLLGTIVVNVIVRPDGSVRPGSASINVGRCSGLAADIKATRDACVNAAYKCRFSRPAGQSNDLPGEITFKWE